MEKTIELVRRLKQQTRDLEKQVGTIQKECEHRFVLEQDDKHSNGRIISYQVICARCDKWLGRLEDYR